MNEPALVIFDLAGTMVEDRGEVPAAFGAALAAQGLSVTPEQLAGLRGTSKREALRSLLPAGPDLDIRVESTLAAFRAHLVRAWSASPGATGSVDGPRPPDRPGSPGGVRAVPGAGALIQGLRRRGVRVALNTGFDRETTLFLLQSLGWSTGGGDAPADGATVLVDALVCGDDVARGRPAPDLIRRSMELTGVADPERVATVGDTVVDLLAGAAAGVRWNIGVLSGAHDRSTLAAAPHTHLVGSVAELGSVWGGAGGSSPRVAPDPVG
jgi:phosphoglycolate phosphatase-like HAD superfamily hydrolase